MAGDRTAHPAATDEESYEMPSAKPLLKQAAKLAEAGDFRGAFRAAYLACIAYLDDIRALRFERSRTNWEYLRESAAGRARQALQARCTRSRSTSTAKIYGREACTQEDYRTVVTVYGRLSGEEAK